MLYNIDFKCSDLEKYFLRVNSIMENVIQNKCSYF